MHIDRGLCAWNVPRYPWWWKSFFSAWRQPKLAETRKKVFESKALQQKSQYEILCVIWFAVFLLHFTLEMYKICESRSDEKQKKKEAETNRREDGECILNLLPATCFAKLKFRLKAEFMTFWTNIIRERKNHRVGIFDWKHEVTELIEKHKK